jgi:hypothetical protein
LTAKIVQKSGSRIFADALRRRVRDPFGNRLAIIENPNFDRTLVR